MFVYNKLVDIFPKHQLFYIIGAFYFSVFSAIAIALADPVIGVRNDNASPTRIIGEQSLRVWCHLWNPPFSYALAVVYKVPYVFGTIYERAFLLAWLYTRFVIFAADTRVPANSNFYTHTYIPRMFFSTLNMERDSWCLGQHQTYYPFVVLEALCPERYMLEADELVMFSSRKHDKCGTLTSAAPLTAEVTQP